MFVVTANDRNVHFVITSILLIKHYLAEPTFSTSRNHLQLEEGSAIGVVGHKHLEEAQNDVS